VKYAQIPLDVVDCEKHRLLALESARKSMVLLKNETMFCLFQKTLRRLPCIGPNADNDEILLGNYNGYPSVRITPLKGIREKLPDAEVRICSRVPVSRRAALFGGDSGRLFL